MALDPSQPVYPATPGFPVEAEWSVEAAEHVLQRFASEADRDLKWVDPPHGAHCVTLDTNTWWYRTATGWIAFGGLTTYGDLKAAGPV